jgi:prepilin-type N-terminal cleavage/methylation domain-containing protein
MSKSDAGFTILELRVVVIVMGIIVAMPIPQALTVVQAYRLHADAAVVACDPAIDLSGVCVRL